MRRIRILSKICKLSLRELACTTCGFETVLLSFLHSRVTGQKSRSFESRTVIFVRLKECTGESVTDSTRLTRNAAAFDGRNDIELTDGAGNIEGLIDDELESLKAEIIVYISVVDDDFAGAGVKTDSGN